MRTRALGNTGLRVSELCMGCWQIGGLFWGPMDVKAAQRLLNAAFDAGVNVYDLADVYGNGRSECLIGRTLRDRRDEIVLVTKAGYLPGADSVQRLYETQVKYHDSRYVQWCCEMSLHRMETDFIDVFLLHDPLLELIRRQSTWNALHKLKRQGGKSVSSAPRRAPREHPGHRCRSRGYRGALQPAHDRASDRYLASGCREGCWRIGEVAFCQRQAPLQGKGAPANAFRFLASRDRPLTEAAIKFALSHEAFRRSCQD